MRFMLDDTFTRLPAYDEGVYGLTYHNHGQFSPIDVRISINTSGQTHPFFLHSIVHESAHALDSLYKDKTGSYLHEQSEFINLYAKYSAYPESSRPISDYAYALSGGEEFLAEAFTVYYRDNFTTQYTNGTTILKADDTLKSATLVESAPDVQAFLEKYICYANHDFNTGVTCP